MTQDGSQIHPNPSEVVLSKKVKTTWTTTKPYENPRNPAFCEMPMFLFWKKSKTRSHWEHLARIEISHMRLALIDLKLYRMCCIHLYTWKFKWLLHNQQQLKFNMATFRGSTPPLLALFLSCPVSIRNLIYGNITISDSWSWFLVSWSSVFIIINSIGKKKTLQDIHVLTIQTNRIIHAHASLTSMM